MVTKRELAELDFSTMEQYFDYIIESWKNGNRDQTIELFNQLRKEEYVGEHQSQVNQFFSHFDMVSGQDAEEKEKKQFKKYVSFKK